MTYYRSVTCVEYQFLFPFQFEMYWVIANENGYFLSVNQFIAYRFSMASPLAMPHYTLKDTTLDGYKIPKDMLVLVNLWSGSRDRAVWGNDADVFRPARFLNDFGQVMLLFPVASAEPQIHILLLVGCCAAIDTYDFIQLLVMETIILQLVKDAVFIPSEPYYSYNFALLILISVHNCVLRTFYFIKKIFPL